MNTDSPNTVSIIDGDIFRFTEGLLVVPRATTGSINAAFENGLYSLGVDYEPVNSSLGEVDIVWNASKKHKNLHIAFATSVNNNSSNYVTIALLARVLFNKTRETEVSNIYCPLLGTGAGNLDPYLCAVLLALPFLKGVFATRFSLVVYEKNIYQNLSVYKTFTEYDLIREYIQRLYARIENESYINDIVTSPDFYFKIAQNRLHDLLNFSISNDDKTKLIEEFKSFSGNFQEFLDTRKDKLQHEFLLLVGEVITYLDSRGYNITVWNKYPDKRSIARAGVRQRDWVSNLLNYSLTKKTQDLPPGIRNAVSYVFDPLREFPILSVRDRRNIVEALTEVEFSDEGFNEVMLTYFERIAIHRPFQPLNLTYLISAILYSPLVKLVWDPDEIRIRSSSTKASSSEPNPTSSATEATKESSERSSSSNGGSAGNNSNGGNSNGSRGGGAGGNGTPAGGNNTDGNSKSYRARLHNDQFAKQDLLDYKLHAQTIVNFIRDKDTQAPLTIGIFAPWGMGKTTLMRFIESNLSESKVAQKSIKNEPSPTGSFVKAALTWCKKKLGMSVSDTDAHFDLKGAWNELKSPPFSKKYTFQYPAVWFNAWKYENSDQILSGLAFEIINQLVRKLPNAYEREKFYFNLNRKRFDEKKLLSDIRKKIYGAVFNKLSLLLVALGVGTIFLAANYSGYYYLGSGGFFFTSMLNSAFEFWKKRNDTAEKYFNDYVKEPRYEEKLGYFHEVEEDVRRVFDLTVDSENPCVIFIDDLDRCSSKKVVEVIEAINLFINGDFPHCYFVIGMDGQMVAASIEAAYKEIDARLSNLQHTYGSLGWYFLEKFVQLQFIIPNLSKESGRLFLRKLLEAKQQEVEEPVVPAAAQSRVTQKDIEELKSQAKFIDLTNRKSLDEFAAKLSNVPDHFIDVAQNIKSEIINRAAEQLKDTEHDIAALLENYAQYLNVSPRVIKRFANLFRFYRFMQTANLASRINELREDEIAQLAILSLRWPQLPRLIQWNTETEFFTGNTTIDRAISLDNWFETGNKNEGPKESCKWLYDDGLFSFIGTNNIKLARYVEVGVW